MLFRRLLASLLSAVFLVGLNAIVASPAAAQGSQPSRRNPNFPGTNIWVANNGSNSVTKLALDGTNQGTFRVGHAPNQMTFDGTSIWVTDIDDNTVTKLLVDGSNKRTFNAGSAPLGIVFDGARIWVANSLDNTLTKLRARDGSLQGTFSVGTYPWGLAFDGSNIWVGNAFDNTAVKIRRDGTFLQVFSVQTDPDDVIF